MKINKRPALLAIGIVTVLVTSACGGESSGADKEKGLLEAGRLKACVNVDFPPLEFYENGTSGTPTGFDVDLAQAVADELDLQLEVQDVAYDGLLPALDAGRCDVAWSGLYVSAERTKNHDALPYLELGNAVLAPDGNPDAISSPGDLSGLSVAVAAGTTAEKQLASMNDQFKAEGKPPMKVASYPKFTEEVAAVTSGKADVMVEVDVAVGYIAQQQEDLEALTGVFPPENELGIYIEQNSPLGASIKGALRSVNEDGTAAELADKYGIESAHLIAK